MKGSGWRSNEGFSGKRRSRSEGRCVLERERKEEEEGDEEEQERTPRGKERERIIERWDEKVKEVVDNPGIERSD